MKFDAEKFTEAVRTSYTIAETLKKMGKKGHGFYKQFHMYVERLKLDTSHFTWKADLKGKSKPPRKPTKEYLRYGSVVKNSVLKSRLLKESLLEYKCEKCGLTDKWKEEKLVLELDHKNGIHCDNRLENLRFLCPNCHSQTDNYCGRNIKSREVQ